MCVCYVCMSFTLWEQERMNHTQGKAFVNTGGTQTKKVFGVRAARPIQLFRFPYRLNRFQKSNLLIVQYKYLKSCSEDFILQILILCTRLCGTDCITQPSWFSISTCSIWSVGNVLYHRYTSSKGNRVYRLYSEGWQTGGRLPNGLQTEDKRRALSFGPRSSMLSLYLNQWYMSPDAHV